MKQPTVQTTGSNLEWLDKMSFAETFNHLTRTNTQPTSSSSPSLRESFRRSAAPPPL
ncbi:hypothetical protein FS842_002745, partial [Serendipita sp. 407]